MTLTISQVFQEELQPTWLQTILNAAVLLELPTTSWRRGDPERVILTIMSYLAQNFDATVSLISQGGFLDFAATGTVTINNPDGTSVVVPVSPDPSDLSVNPNGDPTWLDALTEQNYATTRIRFTYAGGPLALTNTSVSTYGPFDAGGYHASDPFNAATYSNTASLTIPPSTVAGTAITATASAGGLIKITTSSAHGLTTGDAVSILGVLGTTEANGAWYATVLTSTTFTLDGSIFVNAWVSGGKVYLPTVATFIADNGGSGSNSVNAAGDLAVNTVTTAVTSQIGVTVANLDTFEGSDTENNRDLAARAKLKLQSITTNGAHGAYEFYALSSIVYAPLLTPPQVVTVKITRVLVTESLLDGKVRAFLANGSGAPSTPDTTATDAVLQIWPRSLGTTVLTLKATEVSIAVVATVYLPSAYATAANKAIFVAALQSYFRVLPIGGLTDPNGAYTNVVPIEDVRGVIYETAAANNITVDNLTLTLNSGTTNIALTVNTTEADVAVLSPATPTLNLVAT